jgi:hypothetical protein
MVVNEARAVVDLAGHGVVGADLQMSDCRPLWSKQSR